MKSYQSYTKPIPEKGLAPYPNRTQGGPEKVPKVHQRYTGKGAKPPPSRPQKRGLDVTSCRARNLMSCA